MLDLFNPIIPTEEQHPNFKAMLAEINKHAREVILDWTKGFVDRDGKIIKEFQKTFNSSFWEFYIYKCMVLLGFDIDFSHDSPDFMIEKGEYKIAIEATTSNHPQGGTPEWEKTFPPEIHPDTLFQIIHLSTIRIANAIHSEISTA